MKPNTDDNHAALTGHVMESFDEAFSQRPDYLDKRLAEVIAEYLNQLGYVRVEYEEGAEDSAYVPSPDELVHKVQGFNTSAARKALAGEHMGLTVAFYWGDSPQGHCFWGEERGRLLVGKPLSPKACAILEASIKAYEENGEG